MREQSASQGATLQDHPLVVLLTNAVKLSWEWLTDVPDQPLISEVQPFGDNLAGNISWQFNGHLLALDLQLNSGTSWQLSLSPK